MKTFVKFLPILFCLLYAGVKNSYAQAEDISSDIDSMWQNIKVQFSDSDEPFGFSFNSNVVRSYCADDTDCSLTVLKGLVLSAERDFNLPAAVYFSQELLAVGEKLNDLQIQGAAHLDLHRFYHASGNMNLAYQNVDKAIEFFRKSGDQFSLAMTEMMWIEDKVNYLPFEEVLIEFDSLLEKSKNDTIINAFINNRILLNSLEAERYNLAEVYLQNLINSGYDNYKVKQSVAFGRARLAAVNNNFAKAEIHYKEALEIARTVPDKWKETEIIIYMADTERERGNYAKANEYLEEARQIAEESNTDDLLIRIYKAKSELAQQTGDYRGALDFKEKEYAYREKERKKTDGFQWKNYYLESEKNQLRAEKEKQAYELASRNARLKSLYLISFLAVLLTGLSIFGFYAQRKKKKELEQSNAVIKEQARRLENLDAAKSRLFANVSHELRTPLTLILGPLDSVLKSGRLTDRNRSFVKSARHSARDLLKLTNSILDLSKAEHGALKIHEKPEMLYPLLQRFAAGFESGMQYAGIDFNFVYEAEKELCLQLDREKLEVIVNNLLSNALKFTPAGGKVTLYATNLGSEIQIKVTDTGRGIHAADLPHVFDRFYQSENKNAPVEGGTGIGLSLTKNLTELLRGNIRVESKAGEGSTFTVTLPKKETTALPDPLSVEIPEIALGTSVVADTHLTDTSNLPVILIAEDNRGLQDYLRTLLQPNYRLLIADNGQAALDKLSEIEPPALIISDVMMPIKDGFTFLREVKASDKFRHIPMMMLTARADMQDKLKALRIGIDDYLLKPFVEEELLVRIENLLQNRAGRRPDTITESDVPAQDTMSEADRAWLEEFENYVSENLNDSLLTVPNLADRYALSESSLRRRLKGLTGLSPVKYMQEMRLATARSYLERGTYDSIALTAEKVGYRDARTFARLYKKRYGKLPSEV